MARKPKQVDNGIIQALRFVVGAVARKDFDPKLCHLIIDGGVVAATDGLLTATSPIPLQVSAKPHARDMLRAIMACGDEDVMSITHLDATQRLSIKAGKVRSFVKCLADGDTAFIAPTAGDIFPLPADFVDHIRRLAPFMAVDASRPWAMSLRIADKMIYATNNVILVQAWHGVDLPGKDILIPAAAVNEVLRQKTAPAYLQIADNSATFWYGEYKRITTQLVVGNWPENAERIFEVESNLQPISDDFFPAVQTVEPFCEESQKVYFTPEGVASCLAEGEGTRVEAAMPAPHGCFHVAQLLQLYGVATRADFTLHPRPCPFVGDKIRGVILGPRQ